MFSSTNLKLNGKPINLGGDGGGWKCIKTIFCKIEHLQIHMKVCFKWLMMRKREHPRNRPNLLKLLD